MARGRERSRSQPSAPQHVHVCLPTRTVARLPKQPQGVAPHLHTSGTQPLCYAGVQVSLHRAHAACRQRVRRQACQQALQRLPHRQPLAGGQGDAHDAANAHQQLAAKAGGVAVQRVLQEGVQEGVGGARS